MSDRVEQLSRRTLLERTGVTAGALALSGTALVGAVDADHTEHGLGGVGLAEGAIEVGSVFKLTGWANNVELDGTCLTDESTGVTLRRYGIDYCDVDGAASLYVQSGHVQPESEDLYVIQSAAPCAGTDRRAVAFSPATDSRSCFPGDWK